MSKTITVFGSSRPKPGEKDYITAMKLGRILGEINFNVCSGGYQGIMDGVSKGAKDMGSATIGVTVDIFGAKPSEHLTEIIECHSLFERLEKLLEKGDGYVILPGGTGTMLELSLVWEYLNKGLMPKKPVACLGNMWTRIVAEMDIRMEKEDRETGLIRCYNSIEECAEFVCSKLDNG